MLEPSLEVVLDEGARALDPVQLVTLLRDGTDACRPLTWQKPSGSDAIAAQLALRTFVAAACELKTPAAPLASAISEDDPLAAVAKAAGVDRARAEQAIRNGLATAADGLQKDGVLPSTGADALKALSRVVPADRLLLAIQGADDPCSPLAWQDTDGVSEMAAQLVLFGVVGRRLRDRAVGARRRRGADGRRAARRARGAAAPRAPAGCRRGREGGRYRQHPRVRAAPDDRQRADLRRDRDHPRPAVDDPHGAERQRDGAGEGQQAEVDHGDQGRAGGDRAHVGERQEHLGGGRRAAAQVVGRAPLEVREPRHHAARQAGAEQR